MKDTHKIKTAIKLLKEVDSENKNNYFTINKKKYFVFKNGVFNEKNETPVGSIKNGVIIFNNPLFRSKKNTKKGTRKVKSYLESKPVIDASIPMNTMRNTNKKNMNRSMRRNTNKKNMNKPVISNESTISNSYNPLFSKNFSEPEPVEEPVQEPMAEPVEEPMAEPVEEPVQEPVQESEPAPVEEPVTETEEPYDEHKDDF